WPRTSSSDVRFRTAQFWDRFQRWKDARMEEQRSQLEDRPMAELVRQLSDQTTTPVRHEIELAKAEMTAKGNQVGIGAGAFGGAGVVALSACGAITACLLLAPGTAVERWLAALIAGVVYAAAAGILALAGKKKTPAGAPP